MPTINAMVNERCTSGVCLIAHLKHLIVIPPLWFIWGGWFWNAKEHRLRDLWPHMAHILNSLTSLTLLLNSSRKY